MCVEPIHCTGVCENVFQPLWKEVKCERDKQNTFAEHYQVLGLLIRPSGVGMSDALEFRCVSGRGRGLTSLV